MSFTEEDNRPGSPADLREQIDEARAETERQVAEAKAETERVQRELAFVKAGVNTDTPAGQIFFKGYDGDLDPEAIRSTAATMNLTTPSPTPPLEGPPAPETNPLDPAEVDLLESGSNLGGTPPPAEPVAAHPATQAQQVHGQAVADGVDNPTAVGLAFNSLVNAAASGDQRVIIPPPGRE